MTRHRTPLLVLAKMMGHGSPNTTMRYVDVAHADLRKAYDHALDQIQIIDRVHTPNLPTAPSAPSNQETNELCVCRAACVRTTHWFNPFAGFGPVTSPYSPKP